MYLLLLWLDKSGKLGERALWALTEPESAPVVRSSMRKASCTTVNKYAEGLFQSHGCFLFGCSVSVSSFRLSLADSVSFLVPS